MELSAAKTGANTQNTEIKRHIMMKQVTLDRYIDTLHIGKHPPPIPLTEGDKGGGVSTACYTSNFLALSIFAGILSPLTHLATQIEQSVHAEAENADGISSYVARASSASL